MSRRKTLKAEDGFTLIELMAALTLLLVGILGVAATLDRTRDAVTISEARETAVHRAQRELERLRALPYEQLALAGLPAPSAQSSDPAFYVRGGTRYQWDPNDSSRVSDLVTGGAIAPRTPWSDGRLSGSLQVFVTRYDDTAVPGGTAQAKRVIVGVTVDGNASPGRPTVLSTVVHQPPPAP